ncbi:hypothetical protein TRIP_B220021 [uncultured Desulfatiglans sp.]|nr:hypothetical protein TRIP_B220021 [uncultured Desulfatiglans sp.]
MPDAPAEGMAFAHRPQAIARPGGSRINPGRTGAYVHPIFLFVATGGDPGIPHVLSAAAEGPFRRDDHLPRGALHRCARHSGQERALFRPL